MNNIPGGDCGGSWVGIPAGSEFKSRLPNYLALIDQPFYIENLPIILSILFPASSSVSILHRLMPPKFLLTTLKEIQYETFCR